MLEKLVSGGQTGVDRAALDAALGLGFPCGGWCPKGRRAEDGAIGSAYPLRETPTRRYRQRTEWNVLDSDATLILRPAGCASEGTALTIDLAGRHGKPCLQADPRAPGGIPQLLRAMRRRQVRKLNVAGPRESECPGAHAASLAFIKRLLAADKALEAEQGA